MQPAPHQYRNYPAQPPPPPPNIGHPAPRATPANRRQAMSGGAAHAGPQNLTALSSREQITRELNEQKRATQNARNRSMRPVDRDLPTGIEDITIGDGAQRYNKLREVERKLDATMMRKRLDIQDSVYRGSRKYGTMRIWISNTVENQPWQTSGMDPEAFDFGSGMEATFKIKIEGRLLEEPREKDEDADTVEDKDATPPSDDQPESAEKGNNNDNDDEPMAKKPRLATLTPGQIPAQRKRFSRFFKSIVIDFDRPQALQPDNFTRIEWTRPDQFNEAASDLPKNSDFSSLEFERKSDENINITVNLSLDEQPERYRLAQPLAELLDMEEADRTTVLMGLWEYIKLAGLHKEDDSRRVVCDDRLKEIFDRETLQFPELPELIRQHMFDPPPISLPYTIRVDKAWHTGPTEGDESFTPQPTIYDIMVPIEDPLLTQLHELTRSPNHGPTLQEIARIDASLALLVQHMNHSKAKHAFFEAMGADPAGFVRRWTSSQKRDLDVIMGAGVWGDEDWQGAEWRKGGPDGPWGSDEAWEGVGLYLARNRSI